MKISRRLRSISLLLALLFMALLLANCGGLTRSDKPVTHTWMLMPLEQSVQGSSSEPVTSVVVSVVVVPGLDTDRILTLSEDAELNYFAAARWADHIPEMLESLTGRTLQASGNFDVISNHVGGGHEDCDLRLEVQEFFAFSGAPGSAYEVRIVFGGQYSCRSGKSKPIHVQASIPVYEDKMSIIVAAFQKGTDEVLTDLLANIP